MPKNIIPKDNIPKIYEVREVENQIPTYEEFLKTYQQEQVNYEDLTYKDINSNKSYGPMWGNSQYGERWTSLRIPCPVSGCSNTSIINQTHGSCGGQVEVSSQARVRCQRCGSASSIKHWNFSCSSRERGRADVNSLTDALTTALNVRAMDESIVMDLIINLRNNPY